MRAKRRMSRRGFMTSAGVAAAGACGIGGKGMAVAAPEVVLKKSKAGACKPRPDLLDERSPAGAEVIQLTTQTEVPGSHLYMEAQVFTQDSKRFVLHRAAHAHGPCRNDPRHQYLLCDIEDGCSLHVLTAEAGTVGASVSPDGKFLYYFVDETKIGGGRLTLKRVGLDGSDRRTIMVVDSAFAGTKYRPSRLYPLSTISSDGRRLAISSFMGDGTMASVCWGLMVFDLQAAKVELVLHGPTWCNMHPQYSRSLDAERKHDILVQENHGNEATAAGAITRLVGGAGADIHVIRDDGTAFRDMPWGRDGNEFCQGHQCWRGRSDWAITSTGTRQPREAQLIEGRAAAKADHLGIKTPSGVRNDLSREFPNPHFYHFATDMQGQRFISDAQPFAEGGRIYTAELGRAGEDALGDFQYVVNPKCSCKKGAHIHPFLSPDGSMGFFNSDESGLLQAYMVRGLT